jgi:hypothetical protein
MSEVAMITSRDGKNAETIKTETRKDRYPAYSSPEHEQAAGVEKNKLRRREVIQPYLL